MTEIVLRAATSLVPASWNVRRNHDLDGIAESIRVNAFRDPIEAWASQSGTRLDEPHTIIAAEKLGRRCYAMEIEPRYVDVAVRRWMNATGGQAVRESDGFEFPGAADG